MLTLIQCRVNTKSRSGGESGLSEPGSGGWPRPIGMEQINSRLGLMQYMQSGPAHLPLARLPVLPGTLIVALAGGANSMAAVAAFILVDTDIPPP